MSDSAILWIVARQAPLSVGFPKHESWSGLPFPSPGDLSNPGIEPVAPAAPALAGEFFTTESPGKPFPYDLWGKLIVQPLFLSYDPDESYSFLISLLNY